MARKGLAHVERRAVQTGVDVLKRDEFRLLRGRHVGLVTNQTGVDRQGNRTIDLLHQARGVKLVAIFSPEHGITGQSDRAVTDAQDEKTGLPIYSLYGERQRPVPEQLRNIDTLVYDIQDIGCRFYTYLTTLGYILEAAAEHKLKVVVLDRPNPIGGEIIEGPVLDRKLESFTGYHALPIRHGMTVGELAGLFNRRTLDQRGLASGPHGRLATPVSVRPNGPGVDQSFTQHAEPDGRPALSRHRLVGDNEPQRRPRNRSPV
jgi:uncharacterized protein YbbC (DUF1343 family)